MVQRVGVMAQEMQQSQLESSPADGAQLDLVFVTSARGLFKLKSMQQAGGSKARGLRY